ncbi:MAG TPA: HPr family phosphocarrier protein [Pirellulales bacterium]|nr:HPr family phosphocarrier protein [Pirellulales bacterium]
MRYRRRAGTTRAFRGTGLGQGRKGAATPDYFVQGDLMTIMGDTKLSRSVVVSNPNGLHARPADLVVRLASKFKSQIWIAKGPERVDAKSILGVLTLAATQGTKLDIEAAGDDAAEAVEAVATLIAQPQLEEPA